jgi:hypothetical protein
MIFLQYFSERKVQQSSKNHSWKLEYAEGLQEKTKIQQLCVFVQFYLLYQEEQNVSRGSRGVPIDPPRLRTLSPIAQSRALTFKSPVTAFRA